MKSLLLKSILALALFTAATITTNASNVAYQYGFENLCGNLCTTASPWTGTPDVLAVGLSASSWATNYSGGFISYSGSCGASTCQALGISNNNYPSATTYTLTFTVASGKELSITGLSFWDRESGTGPKTANITINGTAAVSNHTLAGTNGANTGTLVLANTFTHITGTVTLVISLSGATAASGTFRLDDFVINGSTNTPGINNYNITGGGNLCAGSLGVAVGLDGSDTGVTYQLQTTGSINVGSPVAGTGSAISFGLQPAAGLYTVLATNDTSHATGIMLGTDTIVSKPVPVVTLAAVAPQCGGTVTLDAGNAGSTFLWSDNSALQTDVVSASGNYSVVVTDSNTCSASASVAVTINTPPTLNFTATNLTVCSGQPSTITATGALTYVWSNNQTTDTITVRPSAPTTYSVIGTDSNSCTASGTASINVLPLVYDTVTTQLCQGLSYNGHSASGTFNDTFTSASGCDSIVTVHLTILPVNHTNLTQTVCFGGSFNGHNATGTFIDTLSSAVTGCDSIITLQLTVLPAITTTLTQTVCFGGSFGGHNATGTFNDTLTSSTGCDSVITLNLTVLSQITASVTHSICLGDIFMGHGTSGTFTDTLTATGGCDSIVTLQLTVNPLPQVSVALSFDTVCSNASAITLAGGLPAGGTYSGSGVSNSQFVPSSATVGLDTVYYSYTDGNSCSNSSYALAAVTICTGINEVDNITFRILPNPAQNYLTIETTGSNSSYAVNLYDMLGRLVISQPKTETLSETTNVNLSQLQAGLYMLNIISGNNEVHSFKIVKE